MGGWVVLAALTPPGGSVSAQISRDEGRSWRLHKQIWGPEGPDGCAPPCVAAASYSSMALLGDGPQGARQCTICLFVFLFLFFFWGGAVLSIWTHPSPASGSTQLPLYPSQALPPPINLPPSSPIARLTPPSPHRPSCCQVRSACCSCGTTSRWLCSRASPPSPPSRRERGELLSGQRCSSCWLQEPEPPPPPLPPPPPSVTASG